MTRREYTWRQCPDCYGPALWTEIRPVPGGYAGNYQCQLNPDHHGDNLPLPPESEPLPNSPRPEHPSR